MCNHTGNCPHIKNPVFKERFVLFSPQRIKAIRIALRESREEFAERFFCAEDTVKCWEMEPDKSKSRELPGPAVRLMILCEREALEKVGANRSPLKRIIKRKEAELKQMFKHLQENQNRTAQNRRSITRQQIQRVTTQAMDGYDLQR